MSQFQLDLKPAGGKVNPVSREARAALSVKIREIRKLEWASEKSGRAMTMGAE
jgi:hypothetical protein